MNINRSVLIEPLVTFRVLFGALMTVGGIRFIVSDWIERLYLEPDFFFKFYGFYWVEVPTEPWIYLIFGLVVVSAIGIMLGAFYRLSAIVFFLSFSYTELLDATNYLNHYYLVCLLSLLMIFLPANRKYAIDVWRKPDIRKDKIPAWCIHIIMFQLCIVYFYAGVAKINSEWLFRAMPMAIWLPERVNTPIIGGLFRYTWVAFAFSWAGMLYDTTIWAFLLNKYTRPFAYFFVVVFHLLTKVLFNIGLFPAIMITSTLIFFSGESHRRIWDKVQAQTLFSFQNKKEKSQTTSYLAFPKRQGILKMVLVLYCAFQLLFPLRHWLYIGNVLWTEEGYRFSWRVMLVEKSGLATFYIKDSESPRKQEIVNGNYLSLYQEKQMAIQPDFILQFAHFLKAEYERKHGFKNAIVTVDAHVAMNGRSSKRYIDPNVNLSEIKDTFEPKLWVMK